MAKQILFQWTGWAPREVALETGRAKQVSCAVVCPSKVAFRRLTDTSQSEMVYVSDMDLRDHPEPGNPVAAAAQAEPGTVFWQDTVRHAPKDAPVLKHPNPEQS